MQIYRNSQNSFIFSAAQQRTVQAALAAEPGTRRYVAETDNPISVAGLTGQHPLTAFRGPAAWTGYPIISGHWYTGPGQAVVSTGFLTLTGKAVGGTVTIVLGGRPIPLRIVGEDFDAQNRGVSVITDWQTLADAHLGPALTAPGQYDIGLRPGVSGGQLCAVHRRQARLVVLDVPQHQELRRGESHARPDRHPHGAAGPGGRAGRAEHRRPQHPRSGLVTNSADGWVTPGEITRLHTPGTPGSEQMLYRFRNAGTAAAVRADAAAVSRALPSGAVTAVQSYLTVREQETSQIGPFVPFLVAFGVIGLVMSVLIVANVVSGAVVSGYRRIGILKSIGFTPGQVVAAYTVQVLVPALAGVLGGLVVGDLLATMLLRQAANAYGVGQLSVPVWVDVAVPVAMLGLVAIAALLPAMGASRLSAVQAIAAGRAPRAGRGYAAHRLLRAAAAAPAGDDRAGGPVRPPGPHRDHAGRRAPRGGRGDLRGRPGQLAEPGGGRPVARGR